MIIPAQAIEAAWLAMSEAMDINSDDRGMYEIELLDGLNTALAAAVDVIASEVLLEAAKQIQKDDPGNHVKWLRDRAEAIGGGL